MLSKNKTLKALIISSNSFGDEGMKELAKVLKCDTTLTELKMWECGLSIIGTTVAKQMCVYINLLSKKIGCLSTNNIFLNYSISSSLLIVLHGAMLPRRSLVGASNSIVFSAVNIQSHEELCIARPTKLS